LFQEELDRLSCVHDHKSIPSFFRLTIQVDTGFPVLETVCACNVPEKFYFSAKDDFFILAGLGSALTVEAPKTDDPLEGFRKIWEIDKSIPVFGGFSFYNDDVLVPEWERFNHCRFTLPFLEIRQSSEGAYLSVNYINTSKVPLVSIVQEITEDLRDLDKQIHVQPLSNKPSGLASELIPDKSHWNSMVKNALHSIAGNIFKKIVLARKKVITHPNAWNPAQIMLAMSKIEENSFTFLYQLDKSIAFLGRSPERLFQIRSGRILAEAIAGTRPRGKNDFDDHSLEAELLDSPKEMDEHRFVSGYIEAVMRRYCSDVKITSREEILKLKNVQHIITRFTGIAESGADPLSIALAFHPTPAVGGYPQERIFEYLRKSEPFNRGWYAAPIGWMNKTNADFAVGIRSALVHRNHLHIFAGAGIVRQSNAQSEWAETEKKMDNFTAILKEH